MASGLGWTQAYRAVYAANQALVSLGRLGVGAQSKSSLGLRRGEPMATLPSPRPEPYSCPPPSILEKVPLTDREAVVFRKVQLSEGTFSLYVNVAPLVLRCSIKQYLWNVDMSMATFFSR